MARMLCGVGLLLLAVFTRAPQGADSGASPIVAGTQTAMTLSLPYRVAAPQASLYQESIALNLVNWERVAAGLAPLIPHATIRSAARAHGIEMFTFGYLSHRSRDGRWPNERVKALGVRAKVVGENLAYAQDVREAHHALITSREHRANMLSPQYRRFGIGVIDGGPYGVIVVQNFSD
jgi:uncharacterized protein YkwD